MLVRPKGFRRGGAITQNDSGAIYILQQNLEVIIMDQNATSDNFVARQSDNFEIVLPRTKIEEALKKLAEMTSAPAFQDAMELVWFKFDPNTDADMKNCISMLLTLHRCILDGNVKPPLSLEELYTNIYQDMEYGNHPSGPSL